MATRPASPPADPDDPELEEEDDEEDEDDDDDEDMSTGVRGMSRDCSTGGLRVAVRPEFPELDDPLDPEELDDPLDWFPRDVAVRPVLVDAPDALPLLEPSLLYPSFVMRPWLRLAPEMITTGLP